MDEKVRDPFGLAHIRTEGAPMHPDDCWPPLIHEEYQSQLKAYNDWLEETK